MIYTYTFSTLNRSVQVGDVAYYSITSGNQSGSNHPNATTNTKPYVLGGIQDVVFIGMGGTVVVDTSLAGGCGSCPQLGPLGGPHVIHFLFFQKDQRINTSGITGYFLDTEYRNYSRLPAEIFATAVDYVESSK